jgi:hypothetical protein
VALVASAAGAGESIEEHVESGPVSASVRVSPASPVIGDAVTLELEVRAEPGVELLMPAFGEALGRFAITAFAPAEEIADDGATHARQRYTLQSSRSGRQSIPPLLIEFVDRRPGRDPAPKGFDAYELLTERVDFEVSSVLPPDAPLEPRPWLGPLPPLAEPAAPRWPWIVAVAAVAAAGAPFAARAFLAARSRSRRRSAYDVARVELEALLYGPRPDAGGMDAFFVKLSGIVRRYLEGRFGLLAPEFTTEEFLEALSASPELVRSQRELLRGFLQRADLVKFAHHVPDDAALQDSIDAAERFLEETRGTLRG